MHNIQVLNEVWLSLGTCILKELDCYAFCLILPIIKFHLCSGIIVTMLFKYVLLSFYENKFVMFLMLEHLFSTAGGSSG